jgi:hypothetical protein
MGPHSLTQLTSSPTSGALEITPDICVHRS